MVARRWLAVLVGCVCVACTTTPPTPPPSTGPVAALSTPLPNPSASPAPTAGPTPTPPPLSIGPRYPDGIPQQIDGEPVLRGAAALKFAAAATDDTPFLLGAWVTWLPSLSVGFGCLPGHDNPDWRLSCESPLVGDQAGTFDRSLFDATTFRFVQGGLSTGPVVVRVRVHDPRAASCGSDAPTCDRMMAAQSIVWAGDSATSPRPLTNEAVARVLADLDPGVAFASRFDHAAPDCGGAEGLAGASILTPEPEPAQGDLPAIVAADVEPSVAARERTLAVPEGVAGAFTKRAVDCAVDGRFAYRWLAVANVAVEIHTHLVPTAADRALVTRIAGRLTEAAAAAPTAAPGATPPSQVATGTRVAWRWIIPILADCGVTSAIARSNHSVLAICDDPSSGPSVRMSLDGVSRIGHAEPTGLAPATPGDALVVNGVAEGPGGGLVLVGAEAIEDESRGDAAAWTSTHGIDWTRVVPPASFHDADLVGVTATQDGFVAVGSAGFPGANVQMPGLRNGAIWTSPDGETWTPGPTLDGSDGVLLEGVISTPTGLLTWGDGAPPGTGAMWRSVDGTTWTKVAPPSGGAWGPISEVRSIGSELIAVGTWVQPDAGGDTVNGPGLWTSADGGATWTSCAVPPTPGTSGGFRDVAPVGASIIATANAGRVARSTDGGATWSWLASDPFLVSGTLTDLVPFYDGVVAFGHVEGGDDGSGSSDMWWGIEAPMAPPQP